jgi:predicted ABC-type exoprotein transport system permease subunit
MKEFVIKGAKASSFIAAACFGFFAVMLLLPCIFAFENTGTVWTVFALGLLMLAFTIGFIRAGIKAPKKSEWISMQITNEGIYFPNYKQRPFDREFYRTSEITHITNKIRNGLQC